MIMTYQMPYNDALNSILLDIKPKGILLISGNKSFVKVKPFFDLLAKKYNIKHLNDFEDYPSKSQLNKITKKLQLKNYDVLIAVGGGKILDYGKLISLKLSNTKLSLNKKNQCSKLPIIAIPTTAGSGSEATNFAVLYHKNKKFSIFCKDILPKRVILDYKLILDLNKRNSSISGMDALCQALESIWSINSNEKSLEFSEIALKLITKNLVDSVFQSNHNNKKEMQLGAFYAGKAINITKTTAPHALSYYLTIFHKIPHGEAVGIFIEPFIKYNFRFLDDKRKGIILNVFKAKTIEDVVFKIKMIKSNLRLLSNINQIDGLNFVKLFDSVNYERLKNNPGKLSSDKLLKIINNG